MMWDVVRGLIQGVVEKRWADVVAFSSIRLQAMAESISDSTSAQPTPSCGLERNWGFEFMMGFETIETGP